MVELVLHIGMGKTGTSSIQDALQQNKDILSQQGAEYLGMWFDAVDPIFSGYEGQDRFLGANDSEMDRNAERLAHILTERAAATGHEVFILSNEGLYAEVARFAPFVTRIRKLLPVRVVAYARNPRDWLPSAYNQWMIYHKTNAGPIVPFEEAGRNLLLTYSGINAWSRQHGDIFSLRFYAKGADVVQDFADFLGLSIQTPARRTLERVQESESILRAIYNGRLDEPALPERFNYAIRDLDLSKAPKLDRMIESSFSYGAVEDIISENAGLFEDIHSRCGIDLLAEQMPPASPPNLTAMRERALEQLLLLVMDQADRITMLEERLQALSDRLQE